MSRPGAEDGDFLGRWSRLKRERAAEAGEGRAREAEAAEAEAEAAEPGPEAPPRTDAEILEELGLAEPESLGPGDDFSGFMAKAVPEHLRRRALRRLWLTDPVLANVDGLVDYGQDFTDSAMVVENLQTAWQVGRGYLRDEPEVEEAPAGGVEADESAAAGGETAEDAAEASGEDREGDVPAVEAPAEETAAEETVGEEPVAERVAGGQAGEREAQAARDAASAAPRRIVFRVPGRG